MKIYRLISGAAFAAAACAALAGGSTTVQASGGSVAGVPSGSNSWSGLTQTAFNATIQYGQTGGSDFKLRTGDPSTQSGQQGTPTATGFSGTSPDGTTQTSGSGTVAQGNNPNAPAYYDATWQSTSTASSSGVSFGSGTYDPWGVYARDIQGLGVALGGTADLYYQATLYGGRGSLTSFSLVPGQTSLYNFIVGNTDAGGTPLVNLNVFSNNTFTAQINLQPKFEVYLLDPIAAGDPNLSPFQRVAANGSIRLQNNPTTGVTATQQLTGLLNGYGLQNGKFNRNLDFGILYRGFVLNTSNPNQQVFQWTTDNQVQSTPEPATMAALGLGALAVLRRRRRA